MIGVVRVIENVFIETLFGRNSTLTMISNIGQGVITLSLFFAFVGIGFFLYGGYLALAGFWPFVGTYMIIGGVSFLLSALSGAAAFGIFKYRQRRIKKFRRDIGKKMQAAMTLLDNEFGETIRENPRMAVLISSLSGFLLEEKFN